MESADRLAAFLDGELPDSERTTLERQLAVDPRLRAQLDAMRVADRTLASLSSPQPDPAFSQRLHAQIDAELDRLLVAEPTAAGPAAVPIGPDAPNASAVTTPTQPRPPQHRGRATNTVTRRAHRASRSTRPRPRQHWAPALAGMVAGIAGLFGIGIVVRDLVVPGPEDVFVAMDAATAESFDDGPLESARTDALSAPPSGPPLPVVTGPMIASLGRSLDEADLQALLDLSALHDLAARDWTFEDPTDIATSWSTALRVHLAAAENMAADLTVTTAATAPLGADDRLALDRCLASLDQSSAVIIPAYLELAMDPQDRPIIAVAVVVVDTDGSGATQRQVQTLDPASCDVLEQIDG